MKKTTISIILGLLVIAMSFSVVAQTTNHGTYAFPEGQTNVVDYVTTSDNQANVLTADGTQSTTGNTGGIELFNYVQDPNAVFPSVGDFLRRINYMYFGGTLDEITGFLFVREYVGSGITGAVTMTPSDGGNNQMSGSVVYQGTTYDVVIDQIAGTAMITEQGTTNSFTVQLDQFDGNAYVHTGPGMIAIVTDWTAMSFTVDHWLISHTQMAV